MTPGVPSHHCKAKDQARSRPADTRQFRPGGPKAVGAGSTPQHKQQGQDIHNEGVAQYNLLGNPDANLVIDSTSSTVLVPEPGTALLLLAGLPLLVRRGRK